MDKRDEPGNILKFLIEHEEEIGRLYQLFARIFPEQREFWEGMAAEEQDHARMLRGLAEKVRHGTVSLREDALVRWTAQRFVNYVRSVHLLAKRHAPSLRRALSMAMDIEDAMIEKQVFGSFQASSAEDQHVLETLAEALQDHSRRFKEALAKIPQES